MANDKRLDAEPIIDRFGGIRPMAAKTDIPVTTIQGWSKRNAIPAGREKEIIAAAKDNDIDISDILASNSNASEGPKAEKAKTIPTNDEFYVKDSTAFAEEYHQKNLKNGVLGTCAVIISLVAIALAFFAFRSTPNPQELDMALTGLEAKIQGTESKMNGRTQALDRRVAKVEKDVEDVKTKVNTEAQGNESAEELRSGLERLKTMVEGNETVSGGVEKIQSVAGDLKNNVDNVQAGLQTLQKYAEDNNLSFTDVKAAAMLYGLSQLRSTLDRQTPFKDDLLLMYRWLNVEDDPELKQAMVMLAPYAERGVLSVGGLKNELGDMTESVVKASIAGQNVSVSDEAMNRLNQFIQVTKNGEPVDYNAEIAETQADDHLIEAQEMLNENNVAGAMATLQSLQGDNPQLQALLGPWMEKAKGTIAASNLESLLSGRLLSMTRGQAGAQGSLLNKSSTQRSVVNPAAQPIDTRNLVKERAPVAPPIPSAQDAQDAEAQDPAPQSGF